MLLIGLTGSIATGKSTCSTILSSPPFSLPIIDADHLSRSAVTPTTPLGKRGYKAIIRYFGPSTPELLLPPDPETGIAYINRPALGRRVFGTDPQRVKDRAVLNKIVHPIVMKMTLKAIVKHWWEGHWAVVLDVPLLFESGFDLLCGGVIVVGLKDQEVQIERLLARDREGGGGGGMTRDDAEGRVKSQMSVAEKVERVESCWDGKGRRRGFVVWNDGSREELKGQLEDVVGRLKKGRGAVYTGFGRWFLPWGVWRVVVIILGNWWRRRRFLNEQRRMKAKI
ncbi:CoaE-domain-containing protein [Terfezia boudieri ATCC MYA-4762]|uniref:CoaE-domain-containing protein n=1 Tax=Terfezia boudieri ATCC MYA-4762 TaxID=1051890 RepID=A0A3N4LD33_9PEZI|nr:CoaE-domain-containing protein [Terfezia boudieri ATCC MYA-4762]